MERVDYVDTFIAVADDCPVRGGTVPPARDSPSVAGRTYQLIADHPYQLTSGDVLFTVWADRRGVPAAERAAARTAFYASGQPCLRSSDLGKRYGWGVHADGQCRVALVGVGTPEYDDLAAGRGGTVAVTRAMRSRRTPRPTAGAA